MSAPRKIAIAGTRHGTFEKYGIKIDEVLFSLPAGTIIVTGDCKGIDTLAAQMATMHGFEVDIHYAEWNKYGRAAGPIRNRAMLDCQPDQLFVFCPDIANSSGSRNIYQQAQKRGIKTTLIE